MPGIPPALTEIIVLCLVKSPIERFTNMDVAAERLQALLTSSELSSTDTAPVPTDLVRTRTVNVRNPYLNRVMIKMSEFTPHTGELLERLLADAFAPELISVITNVLRASMIAGFTSSAGAGGGAGPAPVTA